MKIELVGKRKRLGYENTWEYEIIDNNYQKRVVVSESLSPPQKIEEYFGGWERWNEDRIWAVEIGSSITLRHTHDEVALMIYFLYKRRKMEEETGIENTRRLTIDENEWNYLKEEMRVKRENLISEEILESINEETLSNDNTRNNNEFNSVSNSKSLGKIFVIGSLFGIVFLGYWFILKKVLVKKQLNIDS